jgi:hypothetical protein
LQVIKIKEEGTTENLTSLGKLTGGAQQRPPGSQLQIVKAAPTSSTGEQGRGNTSACMFLVTGGAPVRNSSDGEGGPGHLGKPPCNREGKRLLEDQLITLELFNGSGNLMSGDGVELEWWPELEETG